jgi:antitoxin component YwqK of YwqJK toxin-antitoxin module
MKDKKPYNEEGKRHGHWERYWPNGQLQTIRYYDNGRKIGIHKDFYNNGDLDEFHEYFESGLVYSESFYSDKELAYKGYYLNNSEIGYWYENFYSNNERFYYAR